jgi:hypothetical protein
MAKRGHSEEEILRVLREAESGDTVVEVCRKHGISQQTFYLWKKKYAGLGLQDCASCGSCAMRTRAEAPGGGSEPGPAHPSEIVAKNCKASCAARVGGVSGGGPRFEPAAGGKADSDRADDLALRASRDPQEALRVRLRELAGSRVRCGYRRLTVLLRREGWQVNAKRIYRLYLEEGLIVRTQKRRERAQRQRVPLGQAVRIETRWRGNNAEQP